MSFDKIKAMRSAEKFLSQGKIRAAINEYKRITESDPRDFNTLNTLGDLYVKNSNEEEAVGCYRKVAEHYNTQGFAHKAIAIYNKISRLEPDSMEISAKLAQLYQMKGSVVEARSHYRKLAERYQKKGQKVEALEIWKKLAELDPNETDVLMMIGEESGKQDLKEEAVDAYVEAGWRFNVKEDYEAALDAFSKALEVRQHDLKALSGIVKAQINLGCADEAAENLENILREQPYNRDILNLLIECHLDMNNPQAAEQAIINLVEQEPANYPKFLELVKIYLKENDVDAAARILSMSSEHLLVGGQFEEFLDWTNEILARNPEQLDALQLLVRYYGWQRDETGLKNSLDLLAEGARLGESPEIEKNALTQLIMMSPHESSYAERLQELKILHGFDEEIPQVEIKSSEVPEFEKAANFENNAAISETEDYVGNYTGALYGENSDSFDIIPENIVSDAVEGLEFHNQAVGSEMKNSGRSSFEDNAPIEISGEITDTELSLSEELRIEKEVESIEFYITQGYKDLASKSLDELETEFGNQTVFTELRGKLDDSPKDNSAEIDSENIEIIEDLASEMSEESAQTEEIAEDETLSASEISDNLDDFRSELLLEDDEQTEQSDYETHYHMAVAYQEMGLMEDAIREYQDAINFVEVNDGMRRFFRCSNLLGHCFMEKEMPTIALMWFKRTLETENLTNEEKQGVWYEIANAYEAGGDEEKSLEYFKKIYALNVDYRDTGARIEKLNRK